MLGGCGGQRNSHVQAMFFILALWNEGSVIAWGWVFPGRCVLVGGKECKGGCVTGGWWCCMPEERGERVPDSDIQIQDMGLSMCRRYQCQGGEDIVDLPRFLQYG